MTDHDELFGRLVGKWRGQSTLFLDPESEGDTQPSWAEGTYMVPGYPDWGWRIRLAADGDEMRLLMWNISPQGEDARAVVGTYRREATGS